MDFELPEELRMFKESLRRFVDSEMIPVERQTTLEGGEKLKPEYYALYCKRAQELGFWKMDIPEEYGGGGFSVLARSIVEQELSRSIALPARGMGGITGPSVRAILYSLTGDMKEKYLLPALRGEKKACFAQTEPDAGSDPGGMRTATVTTTSSTASSASSATPATPTSCSSWRRPTAPRARTAASRASSST